MSRWEQCQGPKRPRYSGLMFPRSRHRKPFCASVRKELTGEDARPTLWRGRPRPRIGAASSDPPRLLAEPKTITHFFFTKRNNLMIKSPLQTEVERAGQRTTPNQECAKMKPMTLPRRFPAVYQIAELLRKTCALLLSPDLAGCSDPVSE
jgi:hypothetical protein